MTEEEKPKEPEKLEVGMKIGILHTIAESVYENAERKIREAVANSVDNKATLCVVLIDPKNNKLSIFDNGNGITEKRFKEIFTGIGYGEGKDEVSLLSYFGIGLMSVFQLGKKVTIFTKTVEENKVLKLTVDSDSIFDKKNEEEPLESIKKYIELVESDVNDRKELSPLTDEEIQEILTVFPANFTEIIIENVIFKDLHSVKETDFENRMRKILPLKADEKDPFLLNIDDNVRKSFEGLFSSKDFFPTIDFYYGVLGEKKLKQLWKYFPEFKKEFESGVLNVVYGDTKKFAYYVVYATTDLSASNQEGENNVGFWVRNRNFLFKEADYFIQPGTQKKLIQAPLKNWLYAEIFHINANKMLMVSRNEYLWDSEEFKNFLGEIEEISKKINKELREIYNNKKKIIDSVIEPFVNLRDTSKGALYKIKDRLSEMKIKFEAEYTNDIFEKLKQMRNKSIESEDKRIDEIIKKSKNPIILANNDKFKVIVNPYFDRTENYSTKWNSQSNHLTVNISPRLFEPMKQEVLGKTFDIYLVAATESEPGISFDVDGGKIFINPFNSNIINYSVSFLDIYIAVDLADAYSANKNEMKQYLLHILGMKPKDTKLYLRPMASELKRINVSL